VHADKGMKLKMEIPFGKCCYSAVEKTSETAVFEKVYLFRNSALLLV
jgi:hypothetical protein